MPNTTPTQPILSFDAEAPNHGAQRAQHWLIHTSQALHISNEETPHEPEESHLGGINVYILLFETTCSRFVLMPVPGAVCWQQQLAREARPKLKDCLSFLPQVLMHRRMVGARASSRAHQKLDSLARVSLVIRPALRAPPPSSVGSSAEPGANSCEECSAQARARAPGWRGVASSRGLHDRSCSLAAKFTVVNGHPPGFF